MSSGKRKYKATIGKHSLHTQSNNYRLRLIKFAISYNMVINSTRFPRKNIHKETWLPTGVRFRSQIYHVIIENKHKTIVKSAKSCRRADVDIDHYLILIDRLKISWNGKKKNLLENTMWIN
jgi:hypothetical protein